MDGWLERFWLNGVFAPSPPPDQEMDGMDRVELELPEEARGQVLVLLSADGFISKLRSSVDGIGVVIGSRGHESTHISYDRRGIVRLFSR